MTGLPEFYETLCLVDGFRQIASSIYHEYSDQLSGVNTFEHITKFNTYLPFPAVTSSVILYLEDCSLIWELEYRLRPLNFKLSSRVKVSEPDTPHFISILLSEANFCDLSEWSIVSERINEETSEHFLQALKENKLEQLAISIRATFPFKE